MPPKLQFAFLGPHSSYIASVTWLPLQPDRPKETSTKVYHHGLPPLWMEKYREATKHRYISNFCGNDRFAFMAHSRNRNGVTVFLESSDNMLAEIAILQQFLKTTKDATDPVLLTLGPDPGSFFAEVKSMRRYRWTNLPPDLDEAVQEKICSDGYGCIYDVAINADRGWVMQFKEGKAYNWGGELPNKLKDELEAGVKNEKQIKNLFLNHQNSNDYVLVFTDGTAFVSLHEGFHNDIRTAISLTFSTQLPSRASRLFNKTPDAVKIVFDDASCTCTSDAQDKLNAAYYNARGRFHLRRKEPQPAPKHALTYMREAYRLDMANRAYREDYFMARIAAGKLAQDADECLGDEGFQHEMDFKNDRERRIVELQRRLADLQRDAGLRRLPNEWEYVEYPPLPFPVAHGPGELHGGGGTFELEATESRRFSGQTLSDPRSPTKQMISIWR